MSQLRLQQGHQPIEQQTMPYHWIVVSLGVLIDMLALLRVSPQPLKDET